MSRDGRDFGAKSGGGGVQSNPYQNMDRRERLRRLALETIDLSKDPFLMKNHLGTYECKLCLTLHNNEGNYLAHTQGKRHKMNLARRMAKERKDQSESFLPKPVIPKKRISQKTFTIGRPGYTITKLRDPVTKQKGIFFSIQYPEIKKDWIPRYRFMSAYEQQVDLPHNSNYQYVLFAAEPYDTIGFKIPNYKVQMDEPFWDKEQNIFSLSVQFEKDAKTPNESKTPLAPPPKPPNMN